MNYLAITKDDMLNGEGLRVVLWVAGCSHHCKGCQNAYSWNKNAGVPFDMSAKIEIFEQLSKPYISGITLSGGDPLYLANRYEITKLLRQIKEKFPKKTVWLYTGYNYTEVQHLPLMQYVDVVVDGKFIEELKDNTDKCQWRGSTNQRVIRLGK